MQKDYDKLLKDKTSEIESLNRKVQEIEKKFENEKKTQTAANEALLKNKTSEIESLSSVISKLKESNKDLERKFQDIEKKLENEKNLNLIQAQLTSISKYFGIKS